MKSNFSNYCASRMNVTPVFCRLEMNLDIDRVFRVFFSLKWDLSYRLGLDGISACFCSSTLN